MDCEEQECKGCSFFYVCQEKAIIEIVNKLMEAEKHEKENNNTTA